MFRDGLGRIIGNGKEFFHNDDDWYVDKKCTNVRFATHEDNFAYEALDREISEFDISR